MFFTWIIRAWLRLAGYLALTATCSYLVTVWLLELQVITPRGAVGTITAGLREVGKPLLAGGLSLGIDKAVMIFLMNLTAASLLVLTFYWVTLLDPSSRPRRFPALSRRLQRDRSAQLLLYCPPYNLIADPRLRLTAFLLQAAPLAATLLLGLMVGSLTGSSHYLFGSWPLALAHILPHGLFEIASLLLAASIPYAAYLSLHRDLLRGRLTHVFQHLEQFANDSRLQLCLQGIISLLWVAGVIEADFTADVIRWLQ